MVRAESRFLIDDTEGMTGLEFLQALIDRDLHPSYAELVGFRLVEVGEGYAIFDGLPGEQHYNPQGVVHGGFAASILDSAMGCAIHTVLPRAARYGTVDLKINYVRPITASTGSVRAEGRIVHPGRRVPTADGRLMDASGRLLAHGTTTCMIYD